ncbi:GNAT family N-acetyltransferase [Fulvivirgaceae bacterium PWU4]|uniref:GNAT family N-acetyltransferase n=1 Tax=Chryseosolibacter histidini TaxID=2782349 RepID=A0AAP2GQY0_9BACT|nr:GNAT family N-acetyltransferase [Chryseosolibacter histidini]MBT1699445.1 GNAT family N-acetyltransferase [Chryseosolibacter histidini]
MNVSHEQFHKGFHFSTDKALLDLPYIHAFLSERSYWAIGVPLEIVKRSVENSISIGIYENKKQVGFARVVTDLATFGYLADVFIDEAYRGKGLSKALVAFIFSFEELKFLRRFILATKDAHSLYAKYGFNPLKSPERFMEIARPDIYKQFAS